MALETERPGSIRSYEDLRVYQTSMELLKPVHDLVLTFPEYERFDLANQIRRACKSVPANIAEGYAKKRSAKEFRAYLANAMGSANELVVHMRIAARLEYVSAERCAEFVGAYEILGRQLNKLISSWRTFDTAPPTNDGQLPGDEDQ